MADSETVDTTQQVTSKVPVTKAKYTKRVAAGKAIAEKSRQAREEQKKKLAEAHSIIANEQLRKAEESARKAEEAVKAPTVEKTTPAVETPAVETTTPAVESQTLTTTQWLSIISIIISVVGIYYKREEIKKTFAKIKAPRTPPVDVKAPIKRIGIPPMD